MGHTEVPVVRTVEQIRGLLRESGARRVVEEYGPAGEVVAMTFGLMLNGEEIPYALPVRLDRVMAKMSAERKGRRLTDSDKAQAERVAWRQIFRWLQAQFALIEFGLAKTDEVLMPFIRISGGRTLYQDWYETKFKALPAP